ncbi:MAG: hypothetical protein QW393_03705 [Candidatus Micrarchaeaceae archaeon]
MGRALYHISVVIIRGLYRLKDRKGLIERGIDAAIDKAVRGNVLPTESKRRNLRITRKRSSGERSSSVMKRTFRRDHTFVTTVLRVRVKAMFLCLGHNLLNLLSLMKKCTVSQCYRS